VETTADRLERIEAAVAEIKAALVPDEKKSDRFLYELSDKFAELKDKLEKFKFGSPANIDEDDTPADATFQKRMWKAVMAMLLISALGAILSFKYLLPALPHTMGLFTVFVGVGLWLLLDEYIFIGNSLKKVAKNAIAVSICVLALAVMYWCGITFGNSYLANPYGSYESGGNIAPAASIKRQSDTTTQSIDVVFPQRTGTAAGK
jgi:hypothetical protein